MRLATFIYNHRPTVGVVQGDNITPVDGKTMLEVIADGLAAIAPLAKSNTPPMLLSGVDLLAPIPAPRRNIICLGLNYADHAKESAEARGRETKIPKHPMFFTKATHTVNGPYADIPYNAEVSQDIDWEVELAVVIGQSGKNIRKADAMRHVFGYTVVNDISARDLQSAHGQFFKGKSLDGACPMGPWIVTADEVLDPHRLGIRSRVNGVLKQNANTEQLIFDIPTIIESLSRGMTLEAGDIIATGTPSGVGFARTPPEFLKPGDVVECEIDGVGLIRNQVAGG